jgi:hypothetical protein
VGEEGGAETAGGQLALLPGQLLGIRAEEDQSLAVEENDADRLALDLSYGTTADQADPLSGDGDGEPFPPRLVGERRSGEPAQDDGSARFRLPRCADEN